MKVICLSGNPDCENYVYEKEFETDEENFDNTRCPECGGKVAPAWTKNFRLPGENKPKTERIKLHEKKEKVRIYHNRRKKRIGRAR